MTIVIMMTTMTKTGSGVISSYTREREIAYRKTFQTFQTPRRMGNSIGNDRDNDNNNNNNYDHDDDNNTASCI